MICILLGVFESISRDLKSQKYFFIIFNSVNLSFVLSWYLCQRYKERVNKSWDSLVQIKAVASNYWFYEFSVLKYTPIFCEMRWQVYKVLPHTKCDYWLQEKHSFDWIVILIAFFTWSNTFTERMTDRKLWLLIQICVFVRYFIRIQQSHSFTSRKTDGYLLPIIKIEIQNKICNFR